MRRIRKSTDTPTFKINLGDGDWVEVKSYLTLGERDQINSGLIVTTFDDDGKQSASVDSSRANTLNLSHSIVAWGGPGFTNDEGKIDEVSEENISELDENTAAVIVKALRDKNPRPVGPKVPENSGTTGTSS
jgi:hypothetical protein